MRVRRFLQHDLRLERFASPRHDGFALGMGVPGI
jgi:hypothetical protein